MDYRGDYFADDENEGLSKKAIKRKRIRRIVFYGLAFIIYLIVFIRFFMSCDADLISKVRLSDEARQLYESDKESFTVYKINTKEFMNYDGTIQFKNIVYAETANEFEIGVKYKEKITYDADGNAVDGFPLEYIFEDNLDNRYEICSRVGVKKNGYVYERISFNRVKLDFEYNVLNTKDVDGRGDAFVDEKSERNRVFTLTVVNTVTGKEEDPIVIYDNSTTYERIKKVEFSA